MQSNASDDPRSGEARQEGQQVVAPPALTPAQLYDLTKLKVLSELHDDLEAWGRKRFWLVSAVIVIGGFIGVRTLVRDILHEELSQAAEATATAKAAASSATLAATRSAGFRDILDTLQLKAESLAVLLDAATASVREDAWQSSTHLQVRLDTIAAVLTDLVQNVAPGQRTALVSRISAIRDRTDSWRRQFDAYSEFLIELSYSRDQDDSAAQLASRLRRLGFQVEVYPRSDAVQG